VNDDRRNEQREAANDAERRCAQDYKEQCMARLGYFQSVFHIPITAAGAWTLREIGQFFGEARK
jgi:hypothetical protein